MSSPPDHPAPFRHTVSAGPLLAGLVLGPAAWIVQLIVAYGVASVACDPKGLTPLMPPAAMAADRPALIAANLICLAASFVAGFIAVRAWRRTRGEKGGDGHVLLDTGEGRTRFLAACGVLSAAGFAIAILFNTVEYFSVPACWGTWR